MPVYCYRCKDCKIDFEARHAMSFENQSCVECGSSNVFKIPSMSDSRTILNNTTRPGKIVDDYIKDVKSEINKEKNKLKKREL